MKVKAPFACFRTDERRIEYRSYGRVFTVFAHGLNRFVQDKWKWGYHFHILSVYKKS